MITVQFGRSTVSATTRAGLSSPQWLSRFHSNSQTPILTRTRTRHRTTSFVNTGYSRGGISAFCFHGDRFMTSSSSDTSHLQGQRRTRNNNNKNKNKNRLKDNSKPFGKNKHNSNKRSHFPLFSVSSSDNEKQSFPSPSSKSTPNPSSSSSSTSFTSFFDSVDARMKELQEERQKQKMDEAQKYKEKRQNFSASGTDSILGTVSPNQQSDKRRSIFDLFPLEGETDSTKPPSNSDPPKNENAFDEQSFRAYKTMMDNIVDSPRFVKKKDKQKDIEIVTKFLLNEERTIPYHLPTLYASTSASSNPEQLKKSFETDLFEQRGKFMVETNFTKEQYQLAMRGLTVLGDFCAKRAQGDPLYIAWEKIKEAGMTPRESSMNTYLYAVGVVGVGSLSSTMDNSRSNSSLSFPFLNQTTSTLTRDNDDSILDIPGEIATFHDIMYEPTEKSISLRIKRLVAKGDCAGAEALLATPVKEEKKKKSSPPSESDASNDSFRLRTYFPILKGYCEQGNCTAALRLFKEMKQSPGVQLESENHILVIATLAKHGYFKRDSEPIDSAVETLGYTVGSGPFLFDELVQEMADDVLEITAASARRLYNAFSSAHTINNPEANISCDAPPDTLSSSDEGGGNDNGNGTGEDFLLKALPSLAAMPLNNELAQKNELVVSRIAIDTSTAVCPRTQAKLRLIMLEEHQKQEFYDALVRLSSEQFQTYITSNKAFDPSLNEGDEYAMEQLMVFAEWLDTREGEPFTAIIDGANVAYYGQNFEDGKFNYHQIQFLVDALESKNENVLVTVPHKYATKIFYSNSGPQSKKIILSEAELNILNGLNETGKLYRVPARCLDDYYWMLASVSNQTNSRKGRDLTVAPTSTTNDQYENVNENVNVNQNQNQNENSGNEGRMPGIRPMLLSNDQMRDHKLELMAPRLFRRWTSSHIVNYNFTAFVDDECVDSEIGFSAPDFFSREIQGNPSGGENGDGGIAWHFPVSDWGASERFCVRIPRC